LNKYLIISTDFLLGHVWKRLLLEEVFIFCFQSEEHLCISSFEHIKGL
jgi:hypothetical protein